MRWHRVEGTGELREFLELPGRLHDRRYVPTPHQTIRRWYREGVELYLLRDGGRVIGRTTLHTDAAFDAELGRERQLFGLTEFEKDSGAALFEEIVARAHRVGRGGVFGPVALLPNQAGGVITSGFAERGFIDSAWNPAHYPSEYETFGFVRRFESDTWMCPVTADPDTVFAGAELGPGVRLHRGSRRRFAAQLPILREMLNAAFAQLGYYTEISAAQLAAQTEGLAHLLDESLLLYLTKDDRPIAFVLCVPDISEFLVAVGGDLRLRNQIRLLARRARYRREAVLIIKGTVPDEQGNGHMRYLSRELLRNLRAGGYRTLRSTYVEHTNPGSAHHFRAMGGHPLHGYTFYEKDLT
ncbi:hypothetical protein D5S18_27570 [Nocardia panacis]|uniref:N-acetyltransferase domain-containing protein n=1 Tax=Nocardia panacis TaxID=2340916 RepID=A0A3A4K8D2_9NOCA|nr:hypothetical protein [Nocardia panacis]RJO70937.1 hypothetical protein D5S18_27570 [Nocardia panacis]